jgi:hypothetical protein
LELVYDGSKLRTVAEQTQNKKLQTIAQDITLSVEESKNAC